MNWRIAAELITIVRGVSLSYGHVTAARVLCGSKGILTKQKGQ